jgi:hypothetical protein
MYRAKGIAQWSIDSNRKTSIFFLLFILSWIFGGCSSTAVMRTTVRERPDSMLVKLPPVQISAPSDSICLERSPLDSSAVRGLTAFLDTTVGGTHIRATYAMHGVSSSSFDSSRATRNSLRMTDSWSLKIAPPDTTVHWMVRDSIIDRPVEVTVIPWWIGVVLLAALAAIILSLVRK